MKLKHSLLTLFAAAVIPAMPVQATLDSCVTSMLLTVRVQGDTNWSGDIFTGDVVVIRVTARELLMALEDIYDTDFPSGACLLITTDGDVLVVDRNGNELENVTAYISAYLKLEESLFDGKYNDATGQENSKIYFLIKLSINLPVVTPLGTSVSGEESFDFDLRGVAHEKFNANKPNRQGVQTFKNTINVNLTGDGESDGESILGEGPMVLKGSETVNVDE